MYCRECGTRINEDDETCIKCGTKKDVGYKFCQMCGYHTTERTEFCSNCGAKQITIVTQQMLDTHLLDLQKLANKKKKTMKITKEITQFGVLIAIVLAIILIVRPVPDKIPSLSSVPISPNTFAHDYMGYANYNVQSYWQQSRNLIAYIALCLYVSISSGISFWVNKKQYTKILKTITEVK